MLQIDNLVFNASNRRFFDTGGERARLLVDLVAMAAPYLLILDEPTIISTSTAAGRS
jgi:energy-coupling factor transporter ATP-binding protein EcfA2